MINTVSLDLGVHVPFYDDRKDAASPVAGTASVLSYTNSRFVQVISDPSGGFRGGRKWIYKNLPPDIRHVGGADGIGTATVLADAIGPEGIYGIAANFIAMVADDRIKEGDLPLALFNDISVRNHHDGCYDALMRGLADRLKDQELVMIGGETATLGPCVGSPNPNSQFAFNMSGVALGVNHPKMEVDGSRVKAGDYIVALKQDGFGSNGLTMARRALTAKYGENYYQDAPVEVLKQVAAPCVIYARAVAEALGWYNDDLVKILAAGSKPGLDIHAIAHLSGGGIIEKFGKPFLLKHGLSADISDPFPIPQIAQDAFRWLEESGGGAGKGMSREEFFKTWCNGQRMLIVLPTLEEAEKLIATVGAFGVEAKVSGRVIDTPKGQNSKIHIASEV